MATKPIRVALVDDHPILRNGLRNCLNTIPGVEVVLEVGDGLEYEKKVAEVGHVHVVIVDLFMPNRDGFDTIRWVTRNHPRTRCLVLSFKTDPVTNRKAMRAGARGVLNKSCGYDELRRAVMNVYNNEFHYNEEVSKAMRLTWEQEELDGKVDLHAKAATLAPREKEFLLVYAQHPFPKLKEMETILGLKAGGVEDLRRRVADRIGLRTREGMIIFINETGLK